MEACSTAKDHRDLLLKIYALEADFEVKLTSNVSVVRELQFEIAQKEKEIRELETPRDDSLDNSVIVWLSPAFGNATAGVGQQGASGSTLEVHAP